MPLRQRPQVQALLPQLNGLLPSNPRLTSKLTTMGAPRNGFAETDGFCGNEDEGGE